MISLERLTPLLRSPSSGERLVRQGSQLATVGGEERFPIVDGIPVLVDDATSAFSVNDFTEPREGSRSGVSRLRTLAERALPSVSHNPVARGNFTRLGQELERREGNARVLVIGGSVLGAGMDALLSLGSIELIETDVSFGPRTDLICDGHSLPFDDETFDAVVCQAVLEHVADPPKVVEEVWRVLRRDGLVYSEIPFMQQVHEGAYDFTRFTLVGHRRLYRRFELLASGPVGGPGMALSWSIVHFARAAAGGGSLLGDVFAAVARLATFWLKYLDPFLLRDPTGADAAPGTYLLGRKSDAVLSDRALIEAAGGKAGGHLIERG